MADSENVLGSVSIVITGDTTRLDNSFRTAQANAQTAGTRIAQALTSSLAPGLERNIQLVDQFGRAVQAVAAPVQNLAVGGDKLAAALISIAGAENAAAESAERMAVSHGHAVSEIQAVSGALRTVEGAGAFRAAERFLTLIPGLAGALQAVFPIVGALALIETIGRLIGKNEALKQSEEELKASTEAADAAFAKTEQTLRSLETHHIGNVFGGAAGKNAETGFLKQQAERMKTDIQDAQDEIQNIARAEAGSLQNYIPFHSNEASLNKLKAQKENVRNLGEQLREVQGQIEGYTEDAKRLAEEEAGQLRAVIVSNAENAAKSYAEIVKQRDEAEIASRHRVTEATIEGLDSEYSRVQATWAEEIRIAKERETAVKGFALALRDNSIAAIKQRADAESAGKSKPEQAIIGARASGEIQGANDTYTRTVEAAEQATRAAAEKGVTDVDRMNRSVKASLDDMVRNGWDRTQDAIKRTADIQTESAERMIDARNKAGIIQDRTANEGSINQVQLQKIAMEKTYQETAFHTLSQEIAYRERILSLDDQIRELKIEQLQAALEDAQNIANEADRLKEVARLEAEIAAARGQATTAHAAGQASIDVEQHNKGTFDGQAHQAAQLLSANLSGALAKGVFDGGKNIGKDVRESLKQVGQQIFAKMIDQMIVATVANTAATELNTVWLAVKSFLGFADGGRPPVGVASIVGEKGPELFVPDSAGQIVPAGKFGTGGVPVAADGGHTNNFGDLHFHGVQNVRQMMDSIARVTKNLSPKRSQYSS